MTTGGSMTIRDNVISGNAGAEGIRLILNAATIIQSNRIGMAVDGTTPMGNVSYGISTVEPTISITDVSANEGNAGTTLFTFPATLSAASASPVTVSFATADGTATAPSDYATASGTVTFTAGDTSEPVTINVAATSNTEKETSGGCCPATPVRCLKLDRPS